MKRSRSGKNKEISNQPATPVSLNHNSNSCSNDTVSSNTISSQSSVNPIVQNELKIRSLLKELQFNVKKCQVTNQLEHATKMIKGLSNFCIMFRSKEI